MDIVAIEKEIVTQLQNDLSGSNENLVRAFPNSKEEIRRLHPKGGVLVRYMGSSNNEPVPNEQGFSVQDETQTWQVFLMARNLKHKRPQDSVYDLVRQVKDSLTGFLPPSAIESTHMYPTGDRFLDHDNGMWYHEVLFELTGVHTEC